MIRLLFALLLSLPLFALEGKWTPEQVLRLDPGWLKKQGLEIPPSRIWDAERGTGLLAATINVGGCSGGFISATGLFITNHHCLFSILQQHSTTQRDLITNGFLARSPSEELRGKTVRITIPRRFTDVTREVLAAVPASADDLARYRAIEAKQKQIVAECEKRAGARCQVAVFDGGVRYTLADATELADVRLVYAPPRWVGEFGGEIDNFAWPRHAGDFAIGLAYTADGKPYKPEFWLAIAKQGVKAGDFVMVMGYPGVTYRSLIADQVAERRDLFFPRRADVYGEFIRILEGVKDPAGALAVTATLKSLSNSFKNAQGQLEGFRRGRLLEKHRAAEEEVLKWASGQPQYKAAVDALRQLRAVAAEQRATWERDFLLALLSPSGASFAPRALNFPVTIVRAANERAKPDLERDPEFMERNLPRVRDRLERDEKSYFEPADKAMFIALLKRAQSLPSNQRIAAFERLDPAALDKLYDSSRILTLSERLKMFGESLEQLRARHDPLLDLAFALDSELVAARDRDERWKGADYRLRPAWRAAFMAQAGKPISPDANRTLRVSLAHVKGYAPRDAVLYKPFTTLSGMVEKNTGEEPFCAPAEVLAAARASGSNPPVNFLSDADTTGGNSGSPTVNGRGELVGVNFDRVWENVANDFGYNPDIARNVNVDVRYLLWMLDRVAKADELLRELGVALRAQ